MKSRIIFGFLFISVYVKGQILESINHNGVLRTYNYYVPSAWNSGDQFPLLIVLHGLTQTGGGVMDITQFNSIAEQENFIVAYPNGFNNAWNANMNVSVSGADDKGFIELLINHFQTNFNTNPQKQYLCGFSNGAFMSYKMACESDLCFAAIATVSGTMSDTVYSNCNPAKSTSILHIHGTADAIVPYNGSATTGTSVDQTLEKWRNHLGCSTNFTTIDMPNINLFDLSNPQRITYDNCSGYSLEHIKVIGGGHQWPGISTWSGGLGTINMDFYSPEIIWQFLSSKSCSNSSITEQKIDLKIFPNPTQDLLKICSDLDIGSISIQNMEGKILISEAINDKETIMNLEQIPNGYYILNISYLSRKQENQHFKLFKH